MAEFEVLIVGGGIAGCEAAWALARVGVRCLVITTSLDTVYALYGDRARLAPPAGSLMGAAMQALGGAKSEGAAGGGEPEPGAPGEAVTVGSWALHRQVKALLEAEPRLHLLQSSVSGLIVREGRAVGVTTWEGVDRLADSVVLTVGSFMGARLRIGDSLEEAGRLSEMAYPELYQDLSARGFEFAPAVREVPPVHGSLAYSVEYHTFATSEWEPHSFALGRLEGLKAAGGCVDATLTYEAAARHGMDLARRLKA